ncbi:T9SS type A sorting domain-containing protein [bacterium]|nr:T9SS type A sorting domain-containing protein [bacterium]
MKRVVLFSLVLGLVSAVFAQEGGTPNSVWMYVGSTWWDAQTSGSTGRLIAVAIGGQVHFVWTQSGSTQTFREAYYNCWNTEAGNLVFDTGAAMGGEWRSGFPTVNSGPFGHAIAVYHVNGTTSTYLQGLIEFLPCTGAFQQSTPPYFPETELTMYGRSDVDSHGRLHLVGTADGDSVQMFHVGGTPFYEEGMGLFVDWDSPYQVFDSRDFVYNSEDIACSRISERVAIAWIVDPPGSHDPENIVMQVSEDGGLNWGEITPVTNLPPIDTTCTLSPQICNGDTFRPYRDLSILFDEDDNVHISFSASGYYYFDETGEANPVRTILSSIWHWCDETEQFSLIGQAWEPPDIMSIGSADLMCQKPSLAIDTTTGFLYCAFQQFDRHAYSVSGWAMGEYYCSKSRDNGRSWAVPTNVSNTPGETNMPEIANHPSERDITIAKYVNEGGIHALYMHDRSAGTYFWQEGLPTENDLVYMRTPTSDIAAFPLQEEWEFRATETTVNDRNVAGPSTFMLYPNYPNPFNPATTLQFDLAKAGVVKLAVFDVLGKEVARLVDGRMSAGAHSVEFDGEKFASGVYFARLSVGSLAMARKMVLLK